VLVIFHLLVGRRIFLVEELFLKPYCSVANILFSFMCWYNLVYITFSRIFEKNGSKERCLKLIIFVLSPLLCKRFTSENFNREGKIPDDSDLLHTCVCVCVCVRGNMMNGVLSIGIPSYP